MKRKIYKNIHLTNDLKDKIKGFINC